MRFLDLAEASLGMTLNIMKIVHLIDYFQPKLGYQETFLAKEQKRLGHDVTVVTSDRYYPFADYDTIFYPVLGNRKIGDGNRSEENLPVMRLKSLEISGSPLILLSGLKHVLQQIRPNIVFCHGVYSFLSYSAAKLKPTVNYRLIYDTHAAAFNTNFSGSIFKRMYHQLWKTFICPAVIDASDRIFAIGEEEREFFCTDTGIPTESVPIIRLGVDIDRFKFSRERRNEMRKTLGLKDRDVCIIFAGKMYANKEVHILIESVKLLRGAKCLLLLIGGGDPTYIRQLKERANHIHIKFSSFVDNRQLSDYYNAADLGVWPGNPTITILEAMACRLSVVLSKRKGTAYLDASGGVVWIPRGDSKALATELAGLIQDSKRRKHLGLSGQRFIINHLSWTSIAKETLAL